MTEEIRLVWAICKLLAWFRRDDGVYMNFVCKYPGYNCVVTNVRG